MKKITTLAVYVLIVMAAILTSCKKEPLSGHPRPGKPADTSHNNPGPNPVPPAQATYMVKVKAVINIGTITYDSLPAELEITSWDSAGAEHRKHITLVAGANEVRLPKAHVRYRFRMSKWGISDAAAFTKDNMAEGSLIELGGSRAARKLTLEERFLFAAGNWQADAKTVYSYNGNGDVSKVDYYQKRPQHSDLKLYYTDRFVYSGSRVDKIRRFDHTGLEVGFTEFIYDETGKIVNMHQKSYDQETYAGVEYGVDAQHSLITIDYLYGNGHALEYKMKFRGGNKVEDNAMSSTGAGEGGTYGYDFNINPFAHMNMPNIYLSNLSKNNLVQQQKGYSGSIPSGEPYQFEYSYDGQGYPTELVKRYKAYVTGEELYKTKTIYTY
ncbi:MAG TPA: hypothetical protein VGB46_01570 [Flavisolibacter sp.]|jgi:hypothetical protein